MTDRATSWSITINNPCSADEENIAKARQAGWKVEGQLEKGKSGTPHYQLLVKTPQTRFSAVRKAFPRAHVEIARNVVALQNYVHKEETREGQLQTTNEQYPSRQKVFEWFPEYYHRGMLDWIQRGGSSSSAPVLLYWDEMINAKIREGYFVEGIGMDPQTRSIIKNYAESIVFRSESSIDRQTDRQTDENIVAVDLQNVRSFSESNNSVGSSPSSVQSSPSGSIQEEAFSA